jgi:hypothetical protein
MADTSNNDNAAKMFQMVASHAAKSSSGYLRPSSKDANEQQWKFLGDAKTVLL